MNKFDINKNNELNKKSILIEYDAGYISPKDNREFISEMNKLSRGEKIIEEPLVVYAVMQKYDVENKNGRIYPEPILRREAENYIKLIKDNRAFGECVPTGTEIYTTNGWQNIEDVVTGDKILTLNVENNLLEEQIVSNTINKHYKDDLIHIHNNSSLDMKITKKHKVVLWDRQDKPYILTGEELYEKLKAKDSRVSHSYIKHSAQWVGDTPTTYTIKNSDIEIDINDWVSFLGIFIADGHCSGTRGGKKNNKVIITQVKEESTKKIVELLDRLPFDYTISDNRQFVIINKDLHNELSQLGNSYEKHIPSYVKQYSPELLNTLLEWLLLGDGRNRSNTKGELIKEYVTTSKVLSEDVFEIMMKMGYGATINTIEPKDRYITDTVLVDKEVIGDDGTVELVKETTKVKRLIESANSKTLYNVYLRETKGIYLDHRFTNADKISHDDSVHCVTVPNGTWLMRSNNKVSWTHNCDHPESSIVAISRISHNVTDLWWEGNVLMGKLEIIMSPGFVNKGIISCEGDRIANYLRKGYKIGVSSRGVGSLAKENGKNVVQDDFEIICWDIVTSPSTPGSWIYEDKPSTEQQMSESEDKKDKDLLIDSIDDFLID